MMAPMTPTTKALHRDARNRGLRTFLQGLAVAVLTVVVPIVYGALGQEGGLAAVDWTVTGYAVGTAAAMAALAYLWRVVLDPSGIRSLEPPADHGVDGHPAAGR